jgi:cyclopropane-fatty-acyl-phospholipid synthase
MLNGCAKASDMKLVNLEDIGASYALTLHAWRDRFNANLPEVRALGFSERFIRMWNFYFAYCEGGFIERAISDVHLLLAKPRNLRVQYLPDVNPSV